jgi:hypothetical protein
MRLFLDTEFTDLIPGNKLISIALVDEDENYFYAELTDTYELKDCSDFVKSDVLVLLRGPGPHRMTHYECSLAISKWIEERNVPCIIASDNPSWDWPHLRRLVETLWPENLEKNMIFPVRVSDLVEEALLVKFGYDAHNALDDAFIMKKATLGY